MKCIFKPFKKVINMWKVNSNNTYVWLPSGMLPYNVNEH